MKVLFDARTATPLFPGIGRYSCELARALSQAIDGTEDKLAVIVPPDSALDLRETANTSLIRCAKSPKDIMQQGALEGIAKSCAPDVYHTPYYMSSGVPGVPTVLTMHDCIPLTQPDESTMQARIFFMTCAARALNSCSAAISVSETTRNDCARFFPKSAGKLVTIYHGVSSEFTRRGEEAQEMVSSAFSIERPFILYLGSNRPHKNLSRLLAGYGKALPLLNGHRLVIAGFQCEKTRKDSDIMSKRGISDHVSWIGPVPERALPALFSAAAAFVNPSLYEGFGLPVIEAMACGTPVVCSDTPCLREIAQDGAVYFDPKSVDSIAQALVSTVTAADGGVSRIESAKRRAAEFDWEDVAQKTLEVYRRVAAAR